MEYIRVTKENLEKEHICCAISNNKDIQVSSKKAWLADRFDEGLVFLKSVERGKCFIEYIPAECAWNPIEAPGYMYINCLWVSGSFKGHGYSSDLLSECIEDSKEKGKEGLCILAAARKKPFLADPKFLKYKGFEACDEADNGIQLWHLPFEEKTELPVFKECAKHPHINERGYVLYYTNQCPFNAKYVPILEETAQKNGIPFKAVKIESRKDGKISIVKHNRAGRVMQMVVLLNDFEHAHSLLDGNDGMTSKYGAIHYYEDADIEKWCPELVITKTLGMRTFWDMQQNQEIHKDTDWQDKMVEIEMRVSDMDGYKEIAFFHHLIIEKRWC